MKKIYNKKGMVRAFSLPELLVVLVIIGILVLIALPNLMPLISRAKSIEAQQQLIFLHSLEKTYFYSHSRYSNSLDEIGFEQQPLVTEGGSNANYRIEIVQADENSFKARATAVVDFDQDGIFSTWEIDQEKNLVEVIKD
ncbi:MAG: type IV pilin protein [Mangrovibacterium sp.]